MRPTAPATNRIILALLGSTGPGVRSRDLAQEAGVSQRAASDVLRFLEYHGGVSVSPPRQVRWQRVADIAGMLRFPAMQPVRVVPFHKAPEDVLAATARAGVPATFGFTTAANIWAYFEPHRELQLIVERGSATRAAAALATAATRGAPSQTVTIFEADLDALEITTASGFTVTSRLQTWIDLKHFPRAGAHEAFFRSVIEDLFPQAVRS